MDKKTKRNLYVDPELERTVFVEGVWMLVISFKDGKWGFWAWNRSTKLLREVNSVISSFSAFNFLWLLFVCFSMVQCKFESPLKLGMCLDWSHFLIKFCLNCHALNMGPLPPDPTIYLDFSRATHGLPSLSCLTSFHVRIIREKRGFVVEQGVTR